MVVNFKAREISRGTCKLVQTPTLIKKNSMHKDNCDKKILDTMLTYSIRLTFSFKYLVKILRNSMTIVLKKTRHNVNLLN
jgi:hypothetical protein